MPFEAVRGSSGPMVTLNFSSFSLGPDGHFEIFATFTPAPDDFLRDHRTNARGLRCLGHTSDGSKETEAVRGRAHV